MITDQISMFAPNPLIGANIDELGVRFPDMSHVYTPVLREAARKAKEQEAENAGKSGVFRHAEAILRSRRRGSKKITVLSDFGENFAFWKENRREKRESALPENASAVGQYKMR